MPRSATLPRTQRPWTLRQLPGWVKGLAVALAIALIGWWLSMGAYPHFDSPEPNAAGHRLNSLYSDSSPHIAGDYIVFVSDRGGSQDVYLYEQSSQKLLDLPNLNALDLNVLQVDVAADGQTIVMAASRKGQTDIYLYNRPTQQLRSLTADLAAQVRNPSLSATGDQIAFESDANGQWDIVLCDRAGHCRPLTTPPS